jgi:hypothetical protein
MNLGIIPATVVLRNVDQLCLSEWGTRELRWCLEPITGLPAPEHDFTCVCSADQPNHIDSISVSKRGDASHRALFRISASACSIGTVTRVNGISP